MSQPTIQQITRTLENVAPLHLQESYDNCGLIIGDPLAPCTGALLCVDVTPAIVDEAAALGYNLIIAHHPLIFRGLRHISPAGSNVEKAVIAAIKADIAIYACHTCIDNAPAIGVSHMMARMLGLTDTATLCPADPTDSNGPGCGIIATLAEPMMPQQLIQLVKDTFSSPVARCTAFPADTTVTRIALCGGSGEQFIPQAIAAGAQAYISSDTKYHSFVDYAGRLLIIDIGHFESENCTKQIFYTIIKEKFPNFALRYSDAEINPINYL